MIHKVSVEFEKVIGRRALYKFSYEVKLPNGEFQRVSQPIEIDNYSASITNLLQNIAGVLKASSEQEE